MNYNWPLAVDSFTFWDRLKISLFILNKKNQLTMGDKVEEFEQKMSEYSGLKCLGFSSGSAANQAIFEIWKQQNPEKFKNCLVICPVVTWISSITPATMAGFPIKFCDVNLEDFSFDYERLERILKQNKNKNLIIWPTALIGFTPNFIKLKELAKKYRAELFCDCAENMMSNYGDESILAQCRMSSTSCYFSHELTAIEFGFVFFKNENDYTLGKLIRNHGLIRSLNKNHKTRIKIQKENPTIDPEFLFAVNGTNLRPTNLTAIWGLQDFKRIDKYKQHRKEIYEYFDQNINYNKYYLPSPYQYKREMVGFCLPIFREDYLLEKVKRTLNENSIQTRPIIGSCLTLQPPFKKYHNTADFPNGLWIHEHGCYVGLTNNLNKNDVDKLIKILNNI